MLHYYLLPGRKAIFALASIVLSGLASSQPSTIGQTGLVNMPDAHVEEDGTFRLGTSYFSPYTTIWSSVTLLPRLELSGRYTIIQGLSTELGQGFGDYKDKAFDGKALILREDDWWPDFSLGYQDFTGTGVFKSKYAVASKHFRGTDYTLGYGNDRIDGLFGGMRHRFSWHKNLSVVVEYDANDYQNDLRAEESGAADRDGGWTYGIEYRKGWFGAQLAAQGDDVGGNAWVSVPLMKPEFVPKLDEPAPYPVTEPEADMQQWLASTDSAAKLAHALYQRDFKNIELGFDGSTLAVSLTNTRISQIGRAVGRAARIMLSLGPADMSEIQITYTDKGMPVLTYSFTDVRKLRRYFDGMISRGQLDHYLEITWPDGLQDRQLALADIELPAADAEDLYQDVQRTDEGHLLSYRFENEDLSTFQIIPVNLAVFFNDPNGAARFNLFTRANYTRQIGTGRFFEGSTDISLYEDVSSVSQGSNSTLPHVRSDIGLYLKGDSGRVKLTRLLVNQFLQPAERVYARLSGGIYEMMYAGAGGQVLYVPEKGNWATDLSVNWLQQRATDRMFGFRNYDTVTALGSIHYRIPSWGLTATARAGRFLAKDKGVRFELKRRFRSGITFGAWYTRTDGDDITSPGSPGDPYYDKGIFVSIPLETMLTKDTQSRSELSLRPWTRDVGQMVVSPGDLYTMFERTLMLDNPDHGVGSRLGQ
jgi:Exopolysaccharide biosynthesis protein YbjH